MLRETLLGRGTLKNWWMDAGFPLYSASTQRLPAKIPISTVFCSRITYGMPCISVKYNLKLVYFVTNFSIVLYQLKI